MLWRMQRLVVKNKTRPTRDHTTPVGSVKETSRKASFLDLPAEIRLVIYELIADRTHMTLHPTAAQNRSKYISLPGVILACRQVQQEILATFSQHSKILFYVRNFDFQHVIRFAGKYYRHLEHNEGLVIQILVARSFSSTSRDLDNWLRHRVGAGAALHWHYEARSTRAFDDGGIEWVMNRVKTLEARRDRTSRKDETTELVALLEALMQLRHSLKDKAGLPG